MSKNFVDMHSIKSDAEYENIEKKYRRLANKLQGKTYGPLAEERDKLLYLLDDYDKQRYPLGVPVTPLPCPFCDGNDLDIQLDRRHGYYVFCEACLSSGSYGKNGEESVRAWNRRGGGV